MKRKRRGRRRGGEGNEKKTRQSWIKGDRKLELLQAVHEFREEKKKGLKPSYEGFAKKKNIPKSVFYRQATLPESPIDSLVAVLEDKVPEKKNIPRNLCQGINSW